MASTPITPIFFDTLKKSFVDVHVGDDDSISATDFLEAAESLTTLFDVLGSVAFMPVKSDMLGNVEKIRKCQNNLGDPGKLESLQSLFFKSGGGDMDAAGGLLWLVRGLNFTAKALRLNMEDSKQELSGSFRTAYTETLKQHHNFLIKPIFAAAMSATPYRVDFYRKLGGDQQDMETKMEAWLSALERQVDILKTFLTMQKREV